MWVSIKNWATSAFELFGPPEPRVPAWKQFPHDIEIYPLACQDYARGYLSQWEHYEAMLKRLGLPLPERLTEAQTTYEEHHFPRCDHKGCIKHPERYDAVLTIDPPTYQLPPHLIFKVKPTGSKDSVTVYALIIGSEAEIETARQLYEQKDLLSLLKDFPVRWFTYDPYKFFRTDPDENYRPTFWKREWSLQRDFSRIKWPVEEATGITYETLYQVNMRMRLLRFCASGIYRSPKVADLFLDDSWKGKVDIELPNKILFENPLPPLILDDNCTTLKILPTADTRPDLIEQWLESLQAGIQFPVAFELICQSGTRYFQLACSRQDRAHIEQQLSLYFPAFHVEEHPDPLSTVQPLHHLRAAPKYGYSFLKTMSDFTVDPYNQLLADLSEALPTDVICTQVLFAPLPKAALVNITNFIKDRRGYARDDLLKLRAGCKINFSESDVR
jgi:hypothetical protein